MKAAEIFMIIGLYQLVNGSLNYFLLGNMPMEPIGSIHSSFFSFLIAAGFFSVGKIMETIKEPTK